MSYVVTIPVARLTITTHVPAVQCSDALVIVFDVELNCHVLDASVHVYYARGPPQTMEGLTA